MNDLLQLHISRDYGTIVWHWSGNSSMLYTIYHDK